MRWLPACLLTAQVQANGIEIQTFNIHHLR